MVGGAPPDINTLLALVSTTLAGRPGRSRLTPTMPHAPSKSLSLSLRNAYETLAISFPTMVESVVGRVTKEVCDARLDAWCKKVVEHAKLDVRIVGRENVAPDRTYLVMSNHQSLYDVPVLFYTLGPNIRMIAKTELFKVPIFGPAIRSAGFIEIDRSNRERAIKSLEAARRTFEQGVHVWIAPEGTRSKTGELLPFKKGGFALALETGMPILPIAIRGTRDALAAKGLRSVPGAKVTVTIFPAVEAKTYQGLPNKTGREKLMAEVRRLIESGL